MAGTAFPSMRVIKKEDKHEGLRAFIAHDLKLRRNSSPSLLHGMCYRVAARSPNSPVALAAAEFAEEIAAAGIAIEALFAVRGDAQSTAIELPASLLPGAAFRQITDPRLLDAHEMLVLGTHTAWIGDCMRREPATCDAYECYSGDCTIIAASAKMSFERLWRGARPMKLRWPIAPRSYAGQPTRNDLAGAHPTIEGDDALLHNPASRH